MEDGKVISLRLARRRRTPRGRRTGYSSGAIIVPFPARQIGLAEQVRPKRARLPLAKRRQREIVRPVGDRTLGAAEEANEIDISGEAESLLDGAFREVHGQESISLNRERSSTMNFCESRLLDMTTMADRLTQALADRGITPAELIKALGVSKGTIYNILNGTTKPGKLRASTAQAICSYLGIRVMWLTAGELPKAALGRPRNGLDGPISYDDDTPVQIPSTAFRRVPVVGTASLGLDGYWTDLEYPAGHGDGYFEFTTKDRDAYALQVKGNSMFPAIRSGWYVVVEPGKALQSGEFVLVKLKDGRSTVKEFLWQKDGTYVLSAVSDGERFVFPESEVEFVHHVGGILPPSGRLV